MAPAALSTRMAFSNHTNLPLTNLSDDANHVKPPSRSRSQKPSSKRAAPADENEGVPKKARIGKEAILEYWNKPVLGEEKMDVDSGVGRSPGPSTSRRQFSPYELLKNRALGTRRVAAYSIPCRRFLESFVSTPRDVHRCFSRDSGDLTVPYACEYSHGSKKKQKSLLAISTEQGALSIVDTTPYTEFEYERQRTAVDVHQNAILDVGWSLDDQLIATASADRRTHITSIETQQIVRSLRGHEGTVKCLAWDPNHSDLLSTGGRDGIICLWDTRENASSPSFKISYAHESIAGKASKLGKKVCTPKGVTSAVYLPHSPYQLVSSGSTDGILRKWDLRWPRTAKELSRRAAKLPVDSSTSDPTTLQASRRSRGISSLVVGAGPTSNTIFALGYDSKIHTYNTAGALDTPLDIDAGYDHQPWSSFSHPNLQVKSFYVKIGLSGCGRWLACGGAEGRTFLFDVASLAQRRDVDCVELGVQKSEWANEVMGEVGALDWADGELATCIDDGTVRVWRPDPEFGRAF